ncbi:MAG: 7-cyano-7-deazaguanine synthase QueC [Nitrospina sp.]|jgi:7-cyano-7-deazaguanine synthase|nr:7-cyano-7-deazaguanine synthase QueC [Nitrospina sp.]MBT3413937.1 7-cyano-7-deazaguanine synthase QueC [Nitrospina sp.]MBT3858114.1 7-cyano-7-deazaguanine synthase QueC [Nitrospina sp.]MBT4104517.1 7-cyano-7-deazaguanine synthase QueC [Nitrospina sp.]MBT4389882.1 7-cyano-7-deazaguanine synthase QueC [Nitrospina sp.]
MTEKSAVVLLSGGLDSTTTLALAKKQGFDLFALTFDYGQRHSVELDRARDIARHFGVVDHQIVKIDLRQFGGSALTDSIDVPVGRDQEEMTAEIPITYVPARNTIFLSFCLAYAEVKEASNIFIGVNAVDYSGYPDCRPEFIAAFEILANLATKAGVEGKNQMKIHTPLIELSKAEIIEKGLELGVDYGMTHSCYNPGGDGKSCGVCDSCQLRLKGFQEAGVKDPIGYAKTL